MGQVTESTQSTKDPISRAELFDELNRRGVPYNAEVNKVINWMPSAQQWIPCSERLPEKNGEYLVTRWTGYLQKGLVIDIAKYYEGEWKKAFPVDAWMPLPEPYREDGEAKC